jgi:hypothetical protein
MNATAQVPVRTDVIVLTVLVVLLMLIFALVPLLPDQPEVWAAVQFIEGFVLCPILILLVIKHGYLVARRQHWLGRQRREKEHVDALQIPAKVRKPETFEGVGRIDMAQKEALAPIPDFQGKFRARALTTYAAPAVAVLLAGLQQAFWPMRPFGAGLVLGQAFLVFIVILRIITDRRPAQEWIKRRTRGELFRREQYLCLARVGPYCPGRHSSPETRIRQLGTASLERMTELIAMEDEEDRDRASWLDQLSSQPAPVPIFDDLLDRVTTYQYHRTGKQIAWMRSTLNDTEHSARRIEWFVGIAAACNILVAAVNSFLLLTFQAMPAGQAASGGENVALLRAVIALSAFLPALSGMLLALQSVFNLRFLTENYQLTERSLERLRKELIELQEEVAQTWDGADAPPAAPA